MSSSGAYEGAASGRRMGTWGTSSAGPNNAIYSSLTSLRSRTRELIRNNPLAHGAIDSFVANLIGTGITPRWKLADPVLKEALQELWAESVLEMDASGMCDFYGLQAQITRAWREAGECFVRFRNRRPEDGLLVPLQLQVLESDHVDETYNSISENGNEIRMGIEFNGIDQRVAYHMFKDHPGESFLRSNTTERVRVLASEVLHIFRPLRPGQIRGVPEMSSGIVKAHEVDQCDDAELVRRKTTAMFGGFLKKPPSESADDPNPLGPQDDDDIEGNPVIALEPGTFPELPPGWEVIFSEPKDVGGNYIAWMKENKRDLARAFGVTYEQLTGDLEGVTFSSIRSGLVEFRRLIKQFQSQLIVFQLCRPVIRRWLDMAVLSGAIEIPGYARNRRKYQKVIWCPDGFEWVNPQQDIKAAIMEIRAGLKSRDRVISERYGDDVEVVDREISADNARSDKAGLIFDSDPRNTSGAGVYQDTEGADENKNNE